MKIAALAASFALFLLASFAPDFPQAEISNGLVRARLYLPDAPQN